MSVQWKDARDNILPSKVLHIAERSQMMRERAYSRYECIIYKQSIRALTGSAGSRLRAEVVGKAHRLELAGEGRVRVGRRRRRRWRRAEADQRAPGPVQLHACLPAITFAGQEHGFDTSNRLGDTIHTHTHTQTYKQSNKQKKNHSPQRGALLPPGALPSFASRPDCPGRSAAIWKLNRVQVKR